MSKKVPVKITRAVLLRDDNRCQFPTETGICGETHDLVIHDKTHTGQHKTVADCQAVCQTHHNQITTTHRHAVKIYNKLYRGMKRFGTEQQLLPLGN